VITLPYDFDTSALWVRIVRFVFAITAGLLVAIAGALASGKFGGAIGLALALGILWWIGWRTRGCPLGAAGTLTPTDVEVRPVKVLWYSLTVPVGRFSIDRFQSIAVVERVRMLQPGGSGTDTGSVQLVGKPGTPDIEVAFCDIDQAMEIAQELANLLRLEYGRLDAPGSRAIRLTVL
jgi:hypothetical protein